MIADRQTHTRTHRQTDTLITILRSAIGGGVISSVQLNSWRDVNEISRVSKFCSYSYIRHEAEKLIDILIRRYSLRISTLQWLFKASHLAIDWLGAQRIA